MTVRCIASASGWGTREKLSTSVGYRHPAGRLSEDPDETLQASGVVMVKCRQSFRVNVENGGEVAVRVANRHDDLRAGARVARNVSGELLDVRHDDRFTSRRAVPQTPRPNSISRQPRLP